jgi:DNA-binding transcriptional LysR family regulator
LPVLARISKQNPGLSLSLSLTDRIIDPVEESVDLAIRFGETKDTSGAIIRKLTEQRSLIVASPDYIGQRGAPTTIKDIENHDCIVGFRRDIPTSWRVKAGDGSIFRVTPPATHEIGDGAAIVNAAVAGLGLAQMPSSLLETISRLVALPLSWKRSQVRRLRSRLFGRRPDICSRGFATSLRCWLRKAGGATCALDHQDRDACS